MEEGRAVNSNMILNIYHCDAVLNNNKIELSYVVKEYRFNTKNEADQFSLVINGDVFRDIVTGEYLVYDKRIKDNWSCSRISKKE